jgi:hypothetical protein
MGTAPGPWVQQESSVDGVLNGHAGHPDDIIPPFEYDGGSFPGLNWDAAGQSIYGSGCVLPEPEPEPVGVFVSCTRSDATTYDAVFGYSSANAADVTIPVGGDNGFSPPPLGRGQVTVFHHGNVPSAFTVSGIPRAEVLTWSVTYGGQTSTATTTVSGCPEPPPPEPHVTISVTCVTNGTTTFDAVFGYANGGREAVNVSVGVDNSVDPGGPNRGQPESFLPGGVSRAFTVSGIPNGTEPVWTLSSGGSTATAGASASFANKCGGGPLTPVVSVAPFVRCVDNRGSTYNATFGYLDPNLDPVTVPVGAGNSVSPGGPGLGQPETFVHGVAGQAFTVTGIPQDQSLRWTLSNVPRATQTATASASFGTKCSQPPKPPSVGIFVRCVTNRGGTFDATFGYQNDKQAAVTIPIGAANQFSPAPVDRGQTTNFQPGNVQHAFTVTRIPSAQTIVWMLNSNGARTASASAAFETKCARPPPTAKPIGVFVTCIDKHGSTYDATFGFENDNPSTRPFRSDLATRSVQSRAPGSPGSVRRRRSEPWRISVSPRQPSRLS